MPDDDDFEQKKDALADEITEGIVDIVDNVLEKFVRILSEITERDDPFSEPVTDEQWNRASLLCYRQYYNDKPKHLRERFLQSAAPQVLQSAGYTPEEVTDLMKTPEEARARTKALLEARPN